MGGAGAEPGARHHLAEVVVRVGKKVSSPFAARSSERTFPRRIRRTTRADRRSRRDRGRGARGGTAGRTTVFRAGGTDAGRSGRRRSVPKKKSLFVFFFETLFVAVGGDVRDRERAVPSRARASPPPPLRGGGGVPGTREKRASRNSGVRPRSRGGRPRRRGSAGAGSRRRRRGLLGRRRSGVAAAPRTPRPPCARAHSAQAPRTLPVSTGTRGGRSRPRGRGRSRGGTRLGGGSARGGILRVASRPPPPPPPPPPPTRFLRRPASLLPSVRRREAPPSAVPAAVPAAGPRPCARRAFGPRRGRPPPSRGDGVALADGGDRESSVAVRASRRERARHPGARRVFPAERLRLFRRARVVHRIRLVVSHRDRRRERRRRDDGERKKTKRRRGFRRPPRKPRPETTGRPVAARSRAPSRAARKARSPSTPPRARARAQRREVARRQGVEETDDRPAGFGDGVHAERHLPRATASVGRVRREARERRRRHRAVERDSDAARFVLTDETERRQRRYRIYRARDATASPASAPGARERRRGEATQSRAPPDGSSRRVQVQVRAELETVCPHGGLAVTPRGDALQRHQRRHGRHSSRRDAARQGSRRVPSDGFRTPPPRDARAVAPPRRRVSRRRRPEAVPAVPALVFVRVIAKRTRRAVLENVENVKARGVREEPSLLALDPAIQLGERRGARPRTASHPPSRAAWGETGGTPRAGPRSGRGEGRPGGRFFESGPPVGHRRCLARRRPRPGGPRGVARRVARPRPGRAIFRLLAEPLAPPREGRRGVARARRRARGRARRRKRGARARFAGARIVPAAAPSRAASPHGAGGTCASASAPKTRFGNEGDNAIGRPRRRRFVRGVIREGRGAGGAEQCRRLHALHDAGQPLARAPRRHGDCGSERATPINRLVLITTRASSAARVRANEVSRKKESSFFLIFSRNAASTTEEILGSRPPFASRAIRLRLAEGISGDFERMKRSRHRYGETRSLVINAAMEVEASASTPRSKRRRHESTTGTDVMCD